MTLRQSMAKYLRGLLEETSTPPVSSPPTPSPSLTTETPGPSTTTSSPATLEEVFISMLQTMKDMQETNARETRELVVTILQGREISMTPGQAPESESSESQPPSRMQFDPPDYDDPSSDPPWMAALAEREETEADTVRHLRSEQEVLAAQLEEARAALADPQGPDSGTFLSVD